MTVPPASKFEEKAREIVGYAISSREKFSPNQLESLIVSALEEAVREEREACKTIALRVYRGLPDWDLNGLAAASEIKAAITNRIVAAIKEKNNE